MEYLSNSLSSEELYKAMYEQSQMQLKIFEAMVKADSLSRKYQAQGIYSEAAIQAFNEDAKKKIGGAIKKMCSNFVERLKKWWKGFKAKVISIIKKAKTWLKGHNVFDKDFYKEVKWIEPQLVSKMLDTSYDVLNAITDISEHDMIKICNKVNKKIGHSGRESMADIAEFLEIDTGYNTYIEDVRMFLDKSVKTVRLSEITAKYNLDKIFDTYIKDIEKMEKIIQRAERQFKSFNGIGDSRQTNVISVLERLIMGAFTSIKRFFTQALALTTRAITRASSKSYGEMAEVVAEARMYEAFMADDYDLNSADGVKKFAASRLEAAMSDISDVIDNAFGCTYN